jgi:hypothetical protein
MDIAVNILLYDIRNLIREDEISSEFLGDLQLKCTLCVIPAARKRQVSVDGAGHAL